MSAWIGITMVADSGEESFIAPLTDAIKVAYSLVEDYAKATGSMEMVNCVAGESAIKACATDEHTVLNNDQALTRLILWSGMAETDEEVARLVAWFSRFNATYNPQPGEEFEQ